MVFVVRFILRMDQYLDVHQFTEHDSFHFVSSLATYLWLFVNISFIRLSSVSCLVFGLLHIFTLLQCNRPPIDFSHYFRFYARIVN